MDVLILKLSRNGITILAWEVLNLKIGKSRQHIRKPAHLSSIAL